MKKALFFLALINLFGFKNHTQMIELNGWWDAELSISASKSIQFKMWFHNSKVYLVNGSEKMEMLPIRLTSNPDSFIIEHPVFDSYLVLNKSNNHINGYFKDNSRKGDYRLPLTLKRTINTGATSATTGFSRWQCTFDTAENEYPAIAEFTFAQNEISGTILTETGDYRYLAGQLLANDSFFLSCFDGSHAFLFEGKMKDDKIAGIFYSGNHWQTTWTAFKNPDATLKGGFELTKITSSQPIQLSFLDEQKKVVSLRDSQYLQQAIVIQIMGTWCPNCLDETNYLVKLYNQSENKPNIIALCFERGDDEQIQWERINKVKKNLKVPYPMLLAGKADKNAAAKLFPFLDKIISFPTTLFLNKNHEVVGIHTGFNGPATGDTFLIQSLEFKELIRILNGRKY
jgi:thiol-disulfide isomerase/thioredoxin